MRKRGIGLVAWLALGLALAVGAVAAGCRGHGKGAATAPDPAAPPPGSLEALPAAFRAAREAVDGPALVALAFPLVPTKAELAALLRPGPAADAFLAAYGFFDLPPDHPAVAGLGLDLFRPGDPARTETHVHAATTEELAAYADGSVAFSEFPQGMRRFALAVAAPGVTWYAVEHVKPGEDRGMTFTAFARAGDHFVYVPKPWRGLPKDAGR